MCAGCSGRGPSGKVQEDRRNQGSGVTLGREEESGGVAQREEGREESRRGWGLVGADQCLQSGGEIVRDLFRCANTRENPIQLKGAHGYSYHSFDRPASEAALSPNSCVLF